MRGSKGKEGGRGGGGFILSIIFYIYKLTQPLILKHKKVIGSIPPSPSCKGGELGEVTLGYSLTLLTYHLTHH
jgi:hypothetical protein